MLVVKSVDVRNNFKGFCDKVYSGETLIVSRPKNENIVMLSEAEYNHMLKALKNAEYLESLQRSIEQVEAGRTVTKTMDELLAMEN